MSDGARVAKEAPGERGTDNRFRCGALVVAVSEVAAVDDRHSHRLQKPRPDDVDVQLLVAAGQRTTVHRVEAVDPRPPAKRRIQCERHRPDTSQARKPRIQVPIDASCLSLVGAADGRAHAGQEHLLLLESGIYGLEGSQASHKQRSGSHEHDSQRGLRGNQRSGLTDRRLRHRRRAQVLLLSICARAKSGPQPEEQRGRNHGAHREDEQPPINRRIQHDARRATRQQIEHGRAAPGGQDQAGDAATQSDEQCFREHLPDDAKPAGAQREAKGNLVLPRLGAGQQQARQVHARDKQQHRHRGHQQTQGQGVGAPQVVQSLRPWEHGERRTLVRRLFAHGLDQVPGVPQRDGESVGVHAIGGPTDQSQPASRGRSEQRRSW